MNAQGAQLCAGSGTAPGLPPVDPHFGCCETAAYTDGRDCSCWTEVYDRPAQRTDLQHGPMATRRSMCHDCAYRPDSPERTEADGDLPDYTVTRAFSCHTGMPVLRGYSVPDWCRDGVWKTGAFSVPARLIHDRDNFGPVTRGAHVWQADGTLGEHGAGWAATVGIPRRLEREVAS